MCWAGLLQVGCAWEPSVAAQIFGPSLERGVCRSSELLFLVLRLSRGLVARARGCVWFRTCSCAFLARASFSSLERVSSFFARAIVSSLERESGYRPEGLSSSLDRVFFRSSELLGCWLEQGFLGSSVVSLCLVARATKASLERACFISADSSVFEHHFFTFFFFQTLDPRLSLSKLTLSLKVDLPRVWI